MAKKTTQKAVNKKPQNKAVTKKPANKSINWDEQPKWVTVIGTGQNKHLPKGVERKTGKENAEILIKIGVATLK